MNKELIQDLGWGVGIVVLALIATFTRKLGVIDHETATRLVMGAIGLMVAWFGNRMPKRIAPTGWAREVNRVGGWSMALSGLVWAGLWALAPTSVAVAGGCAAIVSGILITFGYCLSRRGKVKAA